MPGDYSTYQHNLDNDATMYDGDASTPWAGDPNVGPADMHDPSGGPNPSIYDPTSIHDIDMGENPQEVWARANPLDNAQPGQSKRPRVLGSTRDELEKREIAALKDRMTGIDEKIKAHNVRIFIPFSRSSTDAFQAEQEANIIERVTAQWNTQVKDYTERSEKESAARLEAELVALNAEHAKKITELNREAQKRQADYETQIAAVDSRLSAKRPGFRNPSDKMEDVEFPEGPLARPPQFVSETTRKQRVVETIIRDGSGCLPSACMTTATLPASSSMQPATGAQPPSSSSSSAETVDQSLLETLLEALGKPPVQQRVREILGTNGVQKRKRKMKAGEMSSLAFARREEQRKLTHDQDKRWKTIIRRNWYTDRRLPRARDFFNYEGVSEATHKGCEDGLVAPEGPTSKLYFGPGWVNSLWNKKIFQHSIRRILQKRAEDPGHYDVPDVKEDYLMALFSNLLREARAGWSRHQLRAGETNEQACECAETYEMERRERSVGSACKMHKFQYLCRKDGNGIETWTWLKDDLLAELDSGGMSSEEDEELEVVCGDTRRFTTAHSIKILPWRDAKVTDCLKVIDDASELAIEKVAAKCMRMRGSRNSTTAPPLGLPRTLYNEAWLAEQKKFIPNIKEALEISEKEFPIKEITLKYGDVCRATCTQETARVRRGVAEWLENIISGVKKKQLSLASSAAESQTVCGVTCTQETDLVVWKQELPAIKTRRPALVTRSHNPVTHRPLPSATHTSEFPGSIPRQFGLNLLVRNSPGSSTRPSYDLWRLKLQMAQASRILPPGHLLGHYSNKNELYSVHWGSPDVIRQTPSPLQATPINHEVWIPRFRELRYFSLQFPYLLFVPMRNPWHTPLFHSFNRIRYNIPIVSHKDDGFRLAPEVTNHWVDTERCLRVLGRELLRLVPHKRWMDHINLWFFPGRFQFLRCVETEKKARFAVWLSMENFLPLLGYVAMGLWLLQSETSEALYRGEDPPDWRGQVIEKTSLHPSFLEYAEQSVNWQEERVGAIYRIESPQDLTPEQREQRLEDFVPGPRVLESLYVHEADDPGAGAFCERNSLRFSRWAVNAETFNWYEDPFIPPSKRTSATPIAPNHKPSAPAVPAAPFPRLPPNSQQKKGETIQAFFIRRSEGNRKKMANESPVDRQRRTSCAAHAQKGGVPSKGSVFLWEKVDGHYIRQPQIRGEFPDLWDEYLGPQRRFDPFHNEWDLCELFANNDPVFGEGFAQAPDSDDEIDATDAIFPQNIDMASRLAPTDASMNVDTNMEIVHEEHPRNAVQEHPSRRQEHSNFEFEFLNGNYVPGDDELGPYTMESDLPKRDLAKASKECMSLVFLKFGMAPRTEDPKYEPVAANLLDALYKRFGFTMPPSPDTIDVRDPPEECLEPKHLANVIGMADIANQLASDKALQNILCTFFGQCLKARTVNDVDKALLDYHQPQRPKAAPTGFTINREYLTSMRNPAEQMYYYMLAEDGSGIGSEVLLFPRTTDLLEVLRQGWGPDIKGVIKHLLAQGIPFWLAYRRTPPGEISSSFTLPEGALPCSTAGVVVRLARSEVSDDDFFRGFDDDIYDVSDCLWDEMSKHMYWYDRLSDHEVDLLCGIYHVGTSQKRQAAGKGKVQEKADTNTDQASIVSWWPKPNAWAHGSLDGSWWTPQCENDFFAKRLGHFAKGVFVLLRQSQWRSNLKF
ncbi:hypothetical protein B0H14DRAFT_2617811 [Mycena olivaceomarginata]|nr:hypothetical protein B0H14DRAFT_2617811 [Mycena olivaceomarginata]